ncbi:MAG: hypothetical protein PWQ60_733 [Thermoanaerobacteraceae bacterium]|nr:hypothetical protein [Thermoanaerobacteraceae bacterium]
MIKDFPEHFRSVPNKDPKARGLKVGLYMLAGDGEGGGSK